MDIVFLDLPPVPRDIESTLINRVSEMSSDPDSVRWFNEFHDHKINAAEMIYANKHTDLPPNVTKSIQHIFETHLGPVIPVVGRIRNITQQAAMIPPHCDRVRHVAINYILTAGGPSVETVFYQQHRLVPQFDTAENISLDQVGHEQAVQLPICQWHAFNAQRYHGVRNIVDTRIILSLVLEKNPAWQDFLHTHTEKVSKNQLTFTSA